MPGPRPTPIHAAKAHLSELIARALAGEDVVIARGTVPLVRLVPIQPVGRRISGRYRDVLGNCDAVLEPLPDAELDAWEGR